MLKRRDGGKVKANASQHYPSPLPNLDRPFLPVFSLLYDEIFVSGKQERFGLDIPVFPGTGNHVGLDVYIQLLACYPG